MNKRINAALVSVFYKDGLENIISQLHSLGIKIYSTGGTQKFIEDLGIPCISVESLTTYPSILGGRVKTLHPSVFGGILGRRENEKDVEEMKQYNIPGIDLVIVDLYPFEETLRSTSDEKAIIEKIDIGGVSLIRAAAKNFNDVTVIADKKEYVSLEKILSQQNGEISLEQRRNFAAIAFKVCAWYDVAISGYFNQPDPVVSLRYGENPHQQASFQGNLNEVFEQLNGKELSYNNLVDIDAAVSLMDDMKNFKSAVFAIIKHTNVCGVAIKDSAEQAWEAALQGDPESAFGGVLISTMGIDTKTAGLINEIFFEVLIAPSFDDGALEILKSKKNRILLRQKRSVPVSQQTKSVLNGILSQQPDEGNYKEWTEAGGRPATTMEKEDLEFANVICKHLKSNAIAIVKNKQLIGKGCGQTSRVDALRQAIQKAKQFDHDLKDTVLASDAFFPFDDCVKIAHAAGVTCFIQPGGSIRDKDSIEYCKQNNLVMVLTGMRHFKH